MSFTPPANPSCLDESGQPVDYWVALKVPLGSNYFVYTSANDGSFALSPYNLSQSTQGCIMQTVQQIYNFNNETHPVDYGAYNDAPPPPIAAASSVYAHSKGIIMTNATTGFWLIHSVPEWPNTIAQGPAPLPDFTYGQSFMCVTVTASTMDLIAQQLMINRPKIYDRVRSQAFYNTLPNVDKLLKNQYTKDPNNSTTNWKSLNGKPFTQFAKSGPYCKRDLWDDFVAPYFHNAINVETWRNGAGGRISSICGANGMKNSPYDVMEVQSVKLGG
jgi:deoxyribonuclease-2